MESKFVKAYCEVTGNYFGLEVKNFGGVWKVVNFTQLSKEEAKLASTEVSQPSFETNANLLPCLKCGSRKVGGCACAKAAGGCSTSMKYRFGCVYCNKLKIDYSMPDISAAGNVRAGEKIVLSQGQEVVIRFADNKPLTDIIVGVGWDPSEGGQNIDVDTSVVLLSSNNRESDLVYFGAKEHQSGCARLLEDNLTGEHTGNVDSNDDENIIVDLKKVPSDRNKMVFVVNIYECDSRNQTLSKIKNFYIRLYDSKSKKTLIEYNVNNEQIGSRDTAIVIGVATKKAGGWTFKAIGRSLKVSDVRELRDVCVDYL